MPIGNSGIEVDMTTGLPVDQAPNKRQARQQQIYSQTLQESMAVLQELSNSPVLNLLYGQYSLRIQHIAGQDPECQVIEKLIQDLKYKVELAPRVAQDRLDKALGGQLKQLLNRSPQ